MPDLKAQIEEVEKQLQAERAAANQAKKPSERITHLRQVKRLYAKLAQLQIKGVVRYERATKADGARLRSQRSHFMFILAGELLKRAKSDEGIKSIIVRAVGGIEKPKEKEKASAMLALYQEEWAAEVKRKAAAGKNQDQKRAG